MVDSYFFLQAEKTESNKSFIDKIKKWALETKTQTYILDRPLGDDKYKYSYKDALVLLIPNCKITFIDFSSGADSFDEFVDDFVEDLGSISDKYRYKDKIGRPRSWREKYIHSHSYAENVEELLKTIKIEDPSDQRKVELLISLLTGSINDIRQVGADLPDNLLDKIKRKILLFDGDQTRFVYEKKEQKSIRIQGLSGTGKTELLLHKLKDLYVNVPDSRIAITCHNKILADSLRNRIPDFFNFMKVEQQITWNERLWCVHAWGAERNINSGIYSYICYKYDLKFQRWSYNTSFDQACKAALAELEMTKDHECIFDYVLIDESQDFPESFFTLCQKVTKYTVFIAGDIFQSIFDDTITESISPDYLLSKCYRTDPKTLMFAHSLGMGLFEETKLRWLEDKEWEICGYHVERLNSGEIYHLKREPLRRFEDLAKDDFKSVEIKAVEGDFDSSVIENVVNIIEEIRENNPSVTADDIGIVLLDNNNKFVCRMADILAQTIQRDIGFAVNKAHESKKKIPGKLFISNKNNVKGLEFPFIICITSFISDSYSYRNALYMTLTRSFLKSYIIMSKEFNISLLPLISTGLSGINQNGYIEAHQPSDEEKDRIKTTIQQHNKNISYFDFVANLFDELSIPEMYREKLLDIVKNILGEEFDGHAAKKIIQFNYNAMRRG